MDFLLNDDQQMLKDLVERFVADHYAPGRRAAYRALPEAYSAENWEMLGELGLFALPFAESDGGFNGGPVEIMTVMEAFGRGLVVEPFLDMILIGGAMLARMCPPDLRADWIEPVMRGEKRVALAFAEFGARYDLAGGGVRESGGRLSGTKLHVAAGADAWIVTTGTGLFFVEAGAQGVSTRNYRLIDGSWASEITFDSVEATGMGQSNAISDVLDDARIGAMAEMVGIMGRIFEETLDYVRSRKQFGVPIGSFQAIQHRLADQYAALELSRSQLYRAALTHEGRAAAIAGAKSFISQRAIRLGEECIQFHGGMGVSEELEIGNGHKRMLLLATLFGDAQHEMRRYVRALPSSKSRAA